MPFTGKNAVLRPQAVRPGDSIAISLPFPRENVKNTCIQGKSTPILAVRLIAQFPMCLLRRLEDGNSQKNPSSSASQSSSQPSLQPPKKQHPQPKQQLNQQR